MGRYQTPTAQETAQAKRVGAQRIAGPLALAAHFDTLGGRVVVELDRQCSFAFDPTICPSLSGAGGFELSEIEILGAGTAINFPRIDISLSLAHLISDLLAPIGDELQPLRSSD